MPPNLIGAIARAWSGFSERTIPRYRAQTLEMTNVRRTIPRTMFILVAHLGEEIMSYGASIHSHGYHPPITVEGHRGISREQRRLPDTIGNSAPSQREIEAQLIMDRLLREYLKREITVGIGAAH